MVVVRITSATVVGDEVTVTGTVDDVGVEVKVWKSHLDQLPDDEARRTYVAQELKAAAPVPPATIDLTGKPLKL